MCQSHQKHLDLHLQSRTIQTAIWDLCPAQGFAQADAAALYCSIGWAKWVWDLSEMRNHVSKPAHLQKPMRLPWSIFACVSIRRIGWRCKLEFRHVLRFGSFTHTLVSSFAHICPFISQEMILYCCMALYGFACMPGKMDEAQSRSSKFNQDQINSRMQEHLSS